MENTRGFISSRPRKREIVMDIGKGRTRYVALATGAAVLASLTLTGGGPPGGKDGDSRRHTPPGAAKDDRQRTWKTAPPAPRSAEVPPVRSRTIRVEAQLSVGEELDLGTPGRGVGDQFVFSGNLSSTVRSDDGVVGRVGGFCVLTDLARNAGQCSLTAVLTRGQLTVQGEQVGIPTPSPVTNAITGGTGEFRDARGQMKLRALTPATWELTFQVTGR